MYRLTGLWYKMDDLEIGLHTHEKFIDDRRDGVNQEKNIAIKCARIV